MFIIWICDEVVKLEKEVAVLNSNLNRGDFCPTALQSTVTFHFNVEVKQMI